MKRFLIIIPIGILAFSLNYIGLSDKAISDDSGISVCKFQNDEKKCSFCHNDIIKHEILHGPVTDDCETCHQSTGNKHPRAALKGFTLAEKQPDLCYICHEQKNTKPHIHAPIEMGECKSCHSPHGSKFQSLLSKETSPQVCNECHDIEVGDGVMVHAPIKTEGCQSCHDSHQSDHDLLLVEEKSNLCFVCHDAERVIKEQKYVHAPFDDDCSNCHNPHSSRNDFLLTASSKEICFTCHDDIGQIMKDSKFVHKVAEDVKNCSNCHSPHASSNPKILKYKQEKLCFTCHSKEIESGNRAIEDINNKINESKYKHSALEMGGCELCHDPHASDNISLLKGAFPVGDYAPGNSSSFELCFTCHDIEMIESEFTETATNFRNGNLNLHQKHIKGDKGRNCIICHDMHASDNKFLIKKRTVFGSWNMPMNFKISKEGASCHTGCHTELSYNRSKPVKISITDIKPENDKDLIKKEEINTSVEFKEGNLIQDPNEGHIENYKDTVLIKESNAYEEFSEIMPLRIYFRSGKAEFAKSATEEIEKLVGFLKKYSGTNILISGYTDEIGSDVFNNDLAEKRAAAIKLILISKGISSDRIQIIAEGETNPIDTNKTEEGRANNRRVEFKINHN